MKRRSFLQLLGVGATAPLDETRRIYSFLWSNPLVAVASTSTMTSFDALLKEYYSDQALMNRLVAPGPVVFAMRALRAS